MITTSPNAALATLEVLAGELKGRQDGIVKNINYYEGHHNLKFATKRFREAFGALLKEFADNVCGLVVDSTSDRMRIEGFRFPTDEEEGQNTGDTDAWAIWQRSNMDMFSDIAHETMLVTGHAYIIVGTDSAGEPLITVEHPLEVITQHEAGNIKHVTAALKQWWDESTQRSYATLYLPDSIWKWQSADKTTSISANIKWEPRSGVPIATENRLGYVPVVPLVNRMRLDGTGRSELTNIIPLQDAMNKLLCDMIIASEFTSFRQRLLIGMEQPEDENGNVLPDFDLQAAVNRFIIVKDKDVKPFEFSLGDLKGYIEAAQYIRDDIAAISRTPPQYLVGQVVNVSGDALKAAESGLVQKVHRVERYTGEGWEQVMRLAFLVKGDPRSQSFAAETIWGNPEIVTDAAMADSLVKLASLGIPYVALWEKYGASQTEIDRWIKLAEEQKTWAPEGLAAMGAAVIKASTLDAE